MRLFAAAAALLFTAPLYAQSTCTLVVNPTSFAISASTYTGDIAVTQPAGSDCGNFSVTSQANWIHITAGQTGGTVPGKVSFTADSNPSGQSRSAVIRISTKDVTINQDGAACAFGINPKSQSFPIGAGNGSFAVQANCGWSAFGSAAWIAIPSGGSGSSDGTVNFTVAANTCVDGRTGSITVSTGQPTPPVFTITQDGSQSNLSLSATTATAPAGAADYRITVTTGDTCGWSAYSDVSWMTITNGASGTGNGGLVYHLLENKSTVRTGIIHVGALTYTVTQQAPPPPPVVLSSVANAANYATDAVSPGEIVTLFGSNLGPASIVTLQLSSDGKGITNNLAGTQVLFDGVAAPMVYSLAGQVSAVVPYGVAGKSSTKVQVQNQSAASNTLTVNVQAATPGIFTLDASGSGPGAILNQDNTVNTSSNPAARGSIIAIYLTGGGVTTPASVDGSVAAAPPAQLAQTPVVTIGGVNAVVKFAGASPGSLTALTQINVEVPAGVSASLALPVVIKLGDFSSTGAATVAVN
uniref:BACON domain-containing protein n=1 Tax=Solibacter usitatus (strain Ellin6076) TaxID=234267 RepID=Q02CY6_SOLUE